MGECYKGLTCFSVEGWRRVAAGLLTANTVVTSRLKPFALASPTRLKELRSTSGPGSLTVIEEVRFSSGTALSITSPKY